MNLWNQHDLNVMETREKMVLLKESFDKKHGTDIENYSQKLNGFLDRILKKESDLILKRCFFLTIFPLVIQNRKVYK